MTATDLLNPYWLGGALIGARICLRIVAGLSSDGNECQHTRTQQGDETRGSALQDAPKFTGIQLWPRRAVWSGESIYLHQHAVNLPNVQVLLGADP